MNEKSLQQEVNEAIQAGENALVSLRKAEEKLKSAKNWGIFDLLGGGLITDLVKHSKMNDASAYMSDAKTHLQIFQRELKDVQLNFNLQLDISDFLNFADFFFDGLIADYFVQKRINETRAQVASAIDQVEQILRKLRDYNNFY